MAVDWKAIQEQFTKHAKHVDVEARKAEARENRIAAAANQTATQALANLSSAVARALARNFDRVLVLEQEQKNDEDEAIIRRAFYQIEGTLRKEGIICTMEFAPEDRKTIHQVYAPLEDFRRLAEKNGQ